MEIKKSRTHVSLPISGAPVVANVSVVYNDVASRYCGVWLMEDAA